MINDRPLKPSLPNRIDTLSRTQYIEDLIFKQLREINLNRRENVSSIKKSRNENIKVTTYNDQNYTRDNQEAFDKVHESNKRNREEAQVKKNNFSREFEYISTRMKKHSQEQKKISSDISYIKNEMQGIKRNLNSIENDLSLIKMSKSKKQEYKPYYVEKKMRTIQVKAPPILQSEKNLKINSREKVSIGKSNLPQKKTFVRKNNFRSKGKFPFFNGF